MPKVSVIIPVYGVEKYIERCVRSLFEQTLQDMEFIFIDDCTKDNSIYIIECLLKEYEFRAQQTKIVHHEINKGLPAARRTGLMYATGDYVIHCDSDDWVEPSMYEEMYTQAFKEQVDVVICDYFLSDGMNHKQMKQKQHPLCKEDYIRQLLLHKLKPAVWNKLIKRSCYNDLLTYPTHNMAEDLALMIQIFYYSTSFAYLSKSLYYYFFNESSITGDNTFEGVIKRVDQYKRNVCFIEDFLIRQSIASMYTNEIKHLKFSVKNELSQGSQDRRTFGIWRGLFPELTMKDILTLRETSFKAKLLYLLSAVGVYQWYKQLSKQIK